MHWTSINKLQLAVIISSWKTKGFFADQYVKQVLNWLVKIFKNPNVHFVNYIISTFINGSLNTMAYLEDSSVNLFKWYVVYLGTWMYSVFSKYIQYILLYCFISTNLLKIDHIRNFLKTVSELQTYEWMNEWHTINKNVIITWYLEDFIH